MMEAVHKTAKDPAAKAELEIIRSGHDSAYLKIAKGLTLEENGQNKDAIPMYAEGLQFMEKALNVRCDQPFCVGKGWDYAREIQEKMRRIRKVLEERLNYLRATVAAKDDFDDESLRQFAANLRSTPPSYAELQLNDDFLNEGHGSDLASPVDNAAEVFCIPEGAQIFFVTPEGHVSAPSSPSSLKILRLDHPPPHAATNCTTFLQVGTWVYPLMPGASPSLHVDYGAYMLPDLASEVEGACVGIILGQSVSEQSKKHFSDLMNEFTVMKESKVAEVVKEAVSDEKVATLRKENAAEVQTHHEQPSPASSAEYQYKHRYSKKILEGADLVVWAVQNGSEKVHGFVKSQSEAYKSRVAPNGQPLITSPLARTGVKFARVATGWTYKVSKRAVKQVGHVSLIIAKYLAPKIAATVERNLPRSWTQPGEGGGTSKVDDIYEVTASGVQGASMIYLALDNAAQLLAASLIDESVQIVHLKYGEGAADAVHAGGNVVMTGLTVRNLGVKGVAKKAATNTGKIMFEDWRASRDLRGDQGTPAIGQPGASGSNYGSTVTMEAAPQPMYPQLKQ